MSLSTKLDGLRRILQFDNRWHLVASRLIFREPLGIYRKGDVVFLEDHSGGDANGAREVLTSEMYSPYVRLIRTELPELVNAVDIGASNGGFLLLLKSLGLRLNSVVAVEMNPRTCSRLRFNLDLNFQCPRSVLNAAVMDRDGVLSVHLRGSTGDSIFKRDAASERQDGADSVEVSIPAMTLDSVLSGCHPDVLKMDIEGAEYLIFSGDRYEAIKSVRFLLMEIHKEYGNPEEVLERLHSLGFSRVHIPDVAAHPEVHCFRNTNLTR